MEDIAYHESFVRNSVVFAFKKVNNKMEHRQGYQKTKLRVHQYLLIDPKSDPSVSKVVQQTFVCIQLYHEGKFYSSHLE